MTRVIKKNTVKNIVIKVSLITGEKVTRIYKLPPKDDKAYDFLEK